MQEGNTGLFFCTLVVPNGQLALDELPEALRILKGDMSVIGPRPQLVRDMVFMSDEQRMRHTAKPGLSGLAQTKGRNAISWEDKLNWDLKYIEKVSFLDLMYGDAGVPGFGQQIYLRGQDLQHARHGGRHCIRGCV